ncbi:hypothetical protein [Paracraurococcus ruber]|uniref:hypothetical protein n=1 Tax=Paracraurococcus ruber TaxID=77675 RepID=UPI0013052A32|nr:hypothetical protein [Paracraurococcus ruber]
MADLVIPPLTLAEAISAIGLGHVAAEPPAPPEQLDLADVLRLMGEALAVLYGDGVD